MDELISKKDLFEKAAEWEAQAWDMVDKYSPDNDPKNNWEEWYKWSNILRERSGFKHTVMDAPTIIEMPDTGIGDLSDGYHTFNGLYEQRAILFATLVKAYKDKSWKSHRHEDGEPCFGGGWFIVGIDTPKGSYTYHYEDKYWDMFDCVELEKGKHWDGHTESDAETRLMSLKPEPHWIPVTERLPEEERECWITPKTISKVYRGVFTRHYGECHRTGFICDDGFMWLNTALAWMYCEVPEPYKGVTT